RLRRLRSAPVLLILVRLRAPPSCGLDEHTPAPSGVRYAETGVFRSGAIDVEATEQRLFAGGYAVRPLRSPSPLPPPPGHSGPIQTAVPLGEETAFRRARVAR